MEENLGNEDGTPGEAPDPAPDAESQLAWRSFDQNAPPLEHTHHRRRRRLLPVSVAIAVVAAAAVGVVVATGGSSKSGAGLAPGDFVLTATQTTLGQRTADLIFGGTVTDSGHAVPVSGSGEAVLSDPQQFAATILFAAPDGALQEKEILNGSDFYMGTSSGGQDVSSLVPGKHWVQIPVPIGGSGSLGTGTNDPLAQLKMLGAKGNAVTSVGTEVIRGITVTGYAVTISRANLLNAEQSYLASSGFDATTKQQIEQAAPSLPIPTMYVWFDSSKLLRRMGFTANKTENGTDVSVNLEMDFVNYGAPVSISPPSPSDVVQFSQFLAALNAATGSG